MGFMEKLMQNKDRIVLCLLAILVVLQVITLWKVIKVYNAVSSGTYVETVSLRSIEMPQFDELDPRKGTSEEVIVVEYTDYECPFCARHAILTYPQLMENFGDRITYVLKDMPLESIHPRARTVAKYVNCTYREYGSEAAFELKQYVFENRDQWVELSPEGVAGFLKNYLASKGMDVEACVNEEGVDVEITLDLDEAFNTYGFTGTPSFIIAMKGLTNEEIKEIENILEDIKFRARGFDYRMAKSGDYVLVLFSGALPYEVFADIISVKLQ